MGRTLATRARKGSTAVFAAQVSLVALAMQRGARSRIARLVVTLAVGLAISLGDLPGAVTTPIVSWVSLPSAFAFGQVLASGSRLVLTGAQYSYSALATTCYEARVDPTSLGVSRPSLTGCDNPQLDGHQRRFLRLNG